MKADLSRCNRLIDEGFSLMAVREDKRPFEAWKERQTVAFTKEQFFEQYNNPKAGGTGLVCGYQNLEVIDIDLKVLELVSEQKRFWEEYLSFLKDNIADFEDKFVIVKTRNNGYHILYKCATIQGNSKIAKAKGSQEALIESRGIGGYVFIYDQFIQGNGYSDISQISVEDRDILWGVSKYYNYVEERPEPIQETKTVTDYEIGITPWADYNNKTRIWDLISSEFTIVRKLNERTIIRRNGAKSPHSGYIYSNNRLFLFSTGTQYESEKLLSPFAIYTQQRHFGDFTAAAKQLYQDGYGTRTKPREQPKQVRQEPEQPKELTATFPIEVFPEELQFYFKEVNLTLNASIDFLGCSLLWATALCIGNSIKIEIKRGWVEAPSLWMALVGKTGVGKTPSINTIISPLMRRNGMEAKFYNDEKEKYEEYQKMDNKERALHEKIKEPKRKTFIHDDVTIESLLECHSSNPNGIGIYRDELSGWIKDMNKYRAGSDLETWLSCWSNQSLAQSRKTTKSYYIPNGFIPVMGGIQPSILSSHFTPENKENGFVDRMLLCFPELEIEYFNEREMDPNLIKWYDDYIVGLFDFIKKDFYRTNEYDQVSPRIIRFSPESKKEWVRIFTKITDMQRSESESEYMKSFLPKQKSYIARFALMLNVLNHYNHGTNINEITKEAILGAEKLSDYFISMSRKVKIDTIETVEIKERIKLSGKIGLREQFEALYNQNKNLNRSKIADQLGVSRQAVINWIKEMEKL